MPALKLAEIVIVVVAGLAFYVWQMRSLKRDRAETARQMAQAEALMARQANAQDSRSPEGNTQDDRARDISLQEAEAPGGRARADQASETQKPSAGTAVPVAQSLRDSPSAASADRSRSA